MENQQKFFDTDFKDLKIRVEQHQVANQVIYRVHFSDKRTPLVLTRASNDNAARFWTSVPEGRQREAEEVGPVIADYIKTHQ
jgi:hypothetical protein